MSVFKRVLVAAAPAVFLGLSTAVHGAVVHTISFQQGDLRLDGALESNSYATRAVGIRSDAASTNQESGSLSLGNILIGYNGNAFRGLFGFDLSKIEAVAGTNPYTIDEVSFKVTEAATGGAAGGFASGLYAYQPFSETAATWNDPGTNDSTNGGSVGSALVTPVSVDGNSTLSTYTYTSESLRAAAATALSGTSNNLDLLLKRNSEMGISQYYVRLANDENSTVDIRPELVVTFSIVPEPTSVSLLGLAAVASLARRRRRI